MPSRLRGVTVRWPAKAAWAARSEHRDRRSCHVCGDPALVRGCDLENRNPGLLHETEKACAIAASRLYTDALQVTEGAHPGEHLAIALTGGAEGSRFDNPILLIHDRRDVKILMGIPTPPTMR